MLTARPGDILAVQTAGWTGWWVRLGAALHNRPNLSNHIAIVHHVDASRTTWCIEGRPGGAGWADAAAYLASDLTLANDAQPKTDGQRQQVTTIAEKLLGTAYDWDAIAADAAADLGWTLPGWAPGFGSPGQVPAHLVCSSLAAYAYQKAGLAHPGGERGCQPADWDAFILRHGWTRP